VGRVGKEAAHIRAATNSHRRIRHKLFETTGTRIGGSLPCTEAGPHNGPTSIGSEPDLKNSNQRTARALAFILASLACHISASERSNV
jgi:hypothetical protein